MMNRELPSLRILAVDDTPTNLELLNTVLGYAGHEVITANTGEEALEKFKAQQPDLVLMDVMMPGIGGIEATRRMRETTSTRWVPIIFISALSHREDIVAGLDAGGDDYLSKPIDVVLLLTKIKGMRRIASLQESLQQNNAVLQVFRDKSERDMQIARELMEQMIASSSCRLQKVDTWLLPAEKLCGDLIVTQQYQGQMEYVLLADAMGHGLTAALLLLPLVQVFSEMSRNGQPVSAIVQAMNRSLVSLLPVGNFVAVTLIGINRDKKILEVWNGGNPAVLMTDADGAVVRRFESRHMAMGICRGDVFDASSELLQWNESFTLTLYSDGALDAGNAQGVSFGEQRVLATLRQTDTHAALQTALLAHLAGNAPRDDISLATIKL